MKFAETGDTLTIETYQNGKEDGLQVLFSPTKGTREKEYYMKNDIGSTTRRMAN